jgi:LAO/AO transport system kinase
MMTIKKKFKSDKNFERLEAELKDIVLNNIKENIEEMIKSDKTFSNYLKKLHSKKMDPFTAGDKISKSLIK